MWWVRRKWGHRCCWGTACRGPIRGICGVRVIRAVEGGLSARAAAGGRGIDGDRLGWSMAADREFGGQITEGAQPLAIGGAYELAIGANHGANRSHAGGDRRALGGARGASSRQLDLAVLRPTRHQHKKNRARRGAAVPGCGERAAPLEELQQKLDPKKLAFHCASSTLRVTWTRSANSHTGRRLYSCRIAGRTDDRIRPRAATISSFSLA